MKTILLLLVATWLLCSFRAQAQAPAMISPRCRSDGNRKGDIICSKENYNYNGYAISTSFSVTPANPITVQLTYSDSTGPYYTTNRTVTSNAFYVEQRANLPRQIEVLTLSNCIRNNGVRPRCRTVMVNGPLAVDCYNNPDGIIDCALDSRVVSVPAIAQISMTYGDDDVTFEHTQDRGGSGPNVTLIDFQNSGSYYTNINITKAEIFLYLANCFINGNRRTCSQVLSIRYVNPDTNGQPPAPPLPQVIGVSSWYNLIVIPSRNRAWYTALS